MRQFQSRHPAFLRHGRQSGQALIYGVFLLLGGMIALFFLFNTGQLASEKTKLVNTADAVAYSAGVMHARALNFDAYTNRAMIANETTIAQMVSLSSWLKYAQGHVNAVPAMACYSPYSVPVGLGLVKYAPLCYALSYVAGAAAVQYANQGFAIAGPVVTAAAEAAKIALEAAQTSMYIDFLFARKSVMQEVADANYLNDGTISVDSIPLQDNYSVFDGQPFIMPRTGNDRGRFRDMEKIAARKDDFVANRDWSDRSPWPCIIAPIGNANRTGTTDLIGFDRWQANDSAELVVRKWRIHFHRFRLPTWSCDVVATYRLGSGSETAQSSSSNYYYSGVPNFYELSSVALGYTPSNTDKNKRDPRLQFSIRLTRAKAQERTSNGRSPVKPGGQLSIYAGSEAKGVMAAVATSEVYFERFEARGDGKKELASLFNPYWQVHLISNPAPVLAAALLR